MWYNNINTIVLDMEELSVSWAQRMFTDTHKSEATFAVAC